ncbi:MAG: hypothetical protein HC831_12445 [Chloroflexia bacterium]|nr:hypothetical protein [Chloroflexia bacterium]
MGKSKKLLKKQEELDKKEGGTVDRRGLNLFAMDIDGEDKYGMESSNSKRKKELKKLLNVQQGILNLLFNPTLVNYSTDIDRAKWEKK